MWLSALAGISSTPRSTSAVTPTRLMPRAEIYHPAQPAEPAARRTTTLRSRPSQLLGELLLERRLRCSHPRDRHAVGRTAHVVEPRHLEEPDRLRVAAVLAADAQLEVGVRLAAHPGGQAHEPADAELVDRLERAAVEDLLLHVRLEEAALGVVAREAQRRLREVVGAEREEVGMLGDAVGHEARARQLDHRAHVEREFSLGLLLVHPLHELEHQLELL